VMNEVKYTTAIPLWEGCTILEVRCTNRNGLIINGLVKIFNF
jgi:hypothetical protein